MWGGCECCLIMYVYDGREGWFCVLVIFGPFGRGVIVDAMWWDGYYCVYVWVFVKCDALWCPIIVIYY